MALVAWTDMAAETPAIARAIADLWRAAVWLVLPILWCLAVDRISPRAAIDQRPGAKPWAAWALAGVYLAASRALAAANGEGWHNVPTDMPGFDFFAAAIGLVFVAVVEAFVFFGLVLKALRARFGFWPALATTAAMFAAIQVPGWIAFLEFDATAFAVLFAQVFAFGLLMGGTVGLAGTLGPAVALHFLNNALPGFGFSG